MTTGPIDQVLRTGLHHRTPRPAAVVRVVAGILFVVFGGNPTSLTLAPALLVASGYVFWSAGPATGPERRGR